MPNFPAFLESDGPILFWIKFERVIKFVHESEKLYVKETKGNLETVVLRRSVRKSVLKNLKNLTYFLSCLRPASLLKNRSWIVRNF